MSIGCAAAARGGRDGTSWEAPHVRLWPIWLSGTILYQQLGVSGGIPDISEHFREMHTNPQPVPSSWSCGNWRFPHSCFIAMTLMDRMMGRIKQIMYQPASSHTMEDQKDMEELLEAKTQKYNGVTGDSAQFEKVREQF
jgi:hypothetical protein